MITGSINSICKNLSPLIQILGYFILIYKIFLPLILIVIISVDLTKVIVSNKSDELKKCLKNMVIKLALSILIFFVPMISMLIMSFIGQFEYIKNDSGIDYNICYDCMFNPTSSRCNEAIENAEFK